MQSSYVRLPAHSFRVSGSDPSSQAVREFIMLTLGGAKFRNSTVQYIVTSISCLGYELVFSTSQTDVCGGKLNHLTVCWVTKESASVVFPRQIHPRSLPLLFAHATNVTEKVPNLSACDPLK